MKTVISLSVASLLLVSATARAQDPTAPAAMPMAASGEAFGQPGQLLFDASLNAGLTHQIVSFMDQSASITSFAINPSLMYFLIPNLAVGGTIGFQWVSVEDRGSATGFLIGPAAGYNVSISDKLSLFPQVFIAYATQTESPKGQMSQSANQFGLGINAPLFVHVAPHLFFGAGPTLSFTLTSSVEGNDAPKTTTLGLSLFIGGWL